MNSDLPVVLFVTFLVAFVVVYTQPDDPPGFQAAPDISELSIFYYHCHSIDRFTMRFKQMGYQQKVGVFIAGVDVTLNCKMTEHVNDETGRWIVGYIQECDIQATKVRVDVKVVDGPLRLDKVKDMRYIDCSRHFPPKEKEEEYGRKELWETIVRSSFWQLWLFSADKW